MEEDCLELNKLKLLQCNRIKVLEEVTILLIEKKYKYLLAGLFGGN